MSAQFPTIKLATLYGLDLTPSQRAKLETCDGIDLVPLSSLPGVEVKRDHDAGEGRLILKVALEWDHPDHWLLIERAAALVLGA